MKKFGEESTHLVQVGTALEYLIVQRMRAAAAAVALTGTQRHSHLQGKSILHGTEGAYLVHPDHAAPCSRAALLRFSRDRSGPLPRPTMTLGCAL